MKKNILIISQPNVIAGAEVVLIDYLKENNEFEFLFFTNNLMKDYIEKNLGIFNGAAYTSAYPSLNYIKSFRNLLINLIYINKIVREKNVNVIYANNTYDIILTCFYKIFFNRKILIVSHVHDIIDGRKVRHIFKVFEKYIDKIVVPSDATKKSVLNNIENSKLVETVYNSVQVNNECLDKRIINKYDENYKIGFIGRIVDIKRVDLFVDILKELQLFRNDCVGIIAGEIVDKDLFNKINLKIKSDNIKCDYIGAFSSSDIKKIYSELDLLILTSDRDPLPTVILEAMSCGTLVLARDVDGVVEIIEDRVDGFIFNYNEEPQNIAKQINRIIKLDEKDKEKIARRAKIKIENKFSRTAKQKKLNKILNIL